MPSATALPEFVTSRRHRAAAGVGLAVIAALTTAATFARTPGAAGPVAVAASPAAQTFSFAGATPTGDVPTAVPTASTTVTVPAPTAAPTPDGPAITALAEQGIPIVALQAYQNAARLEASEQPSCRLQWTLVAAIGAIESGHGTHAGARLYADGQDLPHVIGPVLDGTAGNARITDTDQGVLDGDKVFDRAVGPMQFIPTTWALHGRDANGDGKADPFNIVDAAATTADYLCAGGGDLSTEAGRKAAVFSYNHLDSYVATVLALDAVYAGRPVPTTSLSPSAAPATPAPSSAAPKPSPRPSPTASRTTTPPTTAPTTPRPTPTPTCPTASPSGSPSASPTGSPTPVPSGCPTPSGPAPSSSAPAPSPSGSAAPSVTGSDAPAAATPLATPTPTG